MLAESDAHAPAHDRDNGGYDSSQSTAIEPASDDIIASVARPTPVVLATRQDTASSIPLYFG